jgi:hypothetical protein
MDQALQIPQLRNVRVPAHGLPMVSLPFALAPNTPFGNMARNHIEIHYRLARVNRRIEEAYEMFARDRASIVPGDCMFHVHAVEEIVYWLRKTADELIGIIQILCTRMETGAYQSKVDPDSIGDLLKAKDSLAGVILKEHISFLELLNNASNAYKHSLINSQWGRYGRDEPCVLALGLKYNDLLKNRPQPIGITLRLMVEQFDAFLGYCEEWLSKCPLNQCLRPSDGGNSNSAKQPSTM